MALTVPHEAAEQTDAPERRGRRLFLWLTVTRAALALVAIPLAPGLYKRHPAVLVLLRPTKEVLLFAGFQVERHRLSLPVAALAAIPLLVPGVWVMFGLGRSYASDLEHADEEDGGVTGLVSRVLPPKKVRALQDLLQEHGMWVVFLGRLAAFPSTLMAAAAGAGGVGWRRFVLADTAGALVSLALLLGLGIGLGDTYESAGPWLTVAGAAVLLGIAAAFGWLLKHHRHRGRR